MDFDDLVPVFGYSVVTDSMSMFGLSAVSSSWVIIFDCIRFNKLEAVLGYLTKTGFISLLFDVSPICYLF